MHGGGGWSHGEDATAQRNRKSEKNGGSEQNAESVQTFLRARQRDEGKAEKKQHREAGE